MNTKTDSSSAGAAVALGALVQPYLMLQGHTEEAIGFYRKVLGAEVVHLSRLRDCPVPMPPDAKFDPNQVLHAAFRIGESVLLATDCSCGSEQVKIQGISLSVTLPDVETATEAFNGLAEGGQLCQPLQETFFAAIFGVVTDRFGVTWMILAGMKS